MFAILPPRTCNGEVKSFEKLIWNKKLWALVCSFGMITQASRACLATPQIGRGPVSRPLTLDSSTALSYQHQDMQPDEISLMLFSKNYNFPARLSTPQIMSGIPLKVSRFLIEHKDFTYTASSHQHQESKIANGICWFAVF